MANQRELDLLLRISTQGLDSLSQVQAQIQAIAATPFTFGGAIDSIKQLAAEFAKLNQSAEQNEAAKQGAQVASEAAKAAQQLAKATAEQEKAAALAQKTEAERLKVQKEAIAVDQQAVKLETEKARAVQATANAEAAQSRAQAAAIRTQRVENPPEKKEGGGLAGGVASGLKAVFPEIAIASAAFNQVSESVGRIGEAFGKVGEFGRQVFEGLLAQVVETRTQILGISSQIAATQQIFADGVKVENPLEAINAVLPEVKKAYVQLQQDSTETISTTAELVPIFQTVTGQLSNLNINIAQAEKLSVRLSQAASGIGLPYQQAQQEIAGLVRGEITVYNQLSKSLGISQTFYNTLVAQGRLYEVLTERTKALAEGQKLAADQLPGVLSTVKDVFEIIVQQAGGPILDALLKPLIAFRDFLKVNQKGFEEFAGSLSTGFVSAVDAIVQPLVTQLQPAFAAVGDAVGAIGKLFSDFSQNQAPVLGEYFGKLAGLIGAVLNAAIVVVVGAFTNLVKIFDVIISNPIVQFLGGAVLTALGAVVDAVTFVVNAFSSFNSAGTNAFGSLFDGLSAIEKQVGTALKPLGTAFQEIQLIIGAVFGGIGKTLQSTFAPVLPILQALGSAIVTGLVFPIKFVGDAFNGLFGFVGQVTAKIRDIIGGIIDSPAFKAFAKVVGINIDEVRTSLKKLNDDADGKGLKKVGDAAEDAGKKITTTNIALDNLGKTPDLLRTQLAGAFRLLGDRTKAEEGAKQVVALTQQALENGTISRAESIKNLQAIQNNTGLELGTRLSAEKAATKIIQDEGQERLEAIKTRETEVQEAVKAGNLSQIEGARQLTALKEEEIDKQIANTQALLDREGAEGRGLGPRATQLRNQLQQQQAERTAIVEEGVKSQSAVIAAGFDNEQKLLEGKQKEGLVGEQAAADQSLDITKRRVAAELEELERQKAKLAPSDTVGRDAIAVKEEALKGQIEESTRKRAAVILKGFDDEQKIIEGKRTQGLLSEDAFANQSLEITKRRIAAELKELERERALLKPGDTAGQQAIAAKEAELNVQREQAEEQFQARKLAIVERAQKKAEDAAKLSEISRNTEIDKLIAARQIREVDAGLLRVQSSRSTIAKELELEKEKTIALEKLKPLSDPVKEEERQVKIRASRIKSAELVDQLVKSEIEQQNALYRLISDRLDRQSQAAETAAKNAILPLQNQLKLNESLSASLDNQNKLLQARKGLQDALSGYAQTELGLLAGTAKTEQEKQKVAEVTAAAKIRALQQQQVFERASLETEIKKNQLALDNERIQNRIAQIQNSADVLKAQAELKKAQADPNATPEGIAAAAAGVDAAKAQGVGLQLQGLLIEQKGQTQAIESDYQRQGLAIKQRGATEQARAELINALPTTDAGAPDILPQQVFTGRENLRERAQLTLQQDLLRNTGLSSNSLGGLNTRDLESAAQIQGGVGAFNLPGQLNQTVAPITQAINPQIEALKQQLAAIVPTSGQRAISPISGNQVSAQLQATLERLNKAVEGNQLRPVTATVPITIQNPDPSTVVDLATRRMTDKLINVLERS